ncbi:MAG: F0F1 ATP synthase subunit B [Elusimicrobiales bacterium]|nr:F0F1 ATP synthase subunit B [Elusimicrobiales bacterium]
MEALVKPEFGLMFWTISIFIILLILLSKMAWKPLIQAIEDRENNLRLERETAQKDREEAELIRQNLDEKLSDLKKNVGLKLDEARKEGQKQRDKILGEARDNAQKLLENSRKALSAEKDKLAKELKNDIAEISLKAAEKVLRKSVDANINKKIVTDLIEDIENGKTLKK